MDGTQQCHRLRARVLAHQIYSGPWIPNICYAGSHVRRHVYGGKEPGQDRLEKYDGGTSIKGNVPPTMQSPH